MNFNLNTHVNLFYKHEKHENCNCCNYIIVAAVKVNRIK